MLLHLGLIFDFDIYNSNMGKSKYDFSLYINNSSSDVMLTWYNIKILKLIPLYFMNSDVFTVIHVNGYP